MTLYMLLRKPELPPEELHQFLKGLCGEHMLPATLNENERLLCNNLNSTKSVTGLDKDGNKTYFISKVQMAAVSSWTRLQALYLIVWLRMTPAQAYIRLCSLPVYLRHHPVIIRVPSSHPQVSAVVLSLPWPGSSRTLLALPGSAAVGPTLVTFQ
jgi:hypothetical protein